MEDLTFWHGAVFGAFSMALVYMSAFPRLARSLARARDRS